jgi:hypothetical protein
VNTILILISNAEKQVYAHDYSFNDMTPFLEKISSGATLIQDKKIPGGWREA